MRTILTSIAAGTMLIAVAAAQPKPRYTVIDLGTLGGPYSFGFGINNAGDVAGAAATRDQKDGFAATAYRWTRQTGMTNLGTLGPPAFPLCPTCNSGAAGIGGGGAVAIGSEIATLDPNGQDFGQWDPVAPTHRVTRTAILRNGVMQALQLLSGGNNANPFWINNRGQVSGVAETDITDPSCSTGPNGQSEPNGLNGPNLKRLFSAVFWEPNGEIHKLSPLVSKGDTVASAFTINDRGEVVGNSGLCSTAGLPPIANSFSTAAHAVLWDKNGVHDLGSLGAALNGATSINNRGEVVGIAESPTDGTIHAFLWTRQTGRMADYGAFPGAVATVPGCCHTINDRGEIVGFAIEPANPYFGRALLWQGAQPRDLNDFVRDPGPFVQLTGAFSINDAGVILCQGVTKSGELHACLAVPNHNVTANDDISSDGTQTGAPMPVPDNVRESLRRRFEFRGR